MKRAVLGASALFGLTLAGVFAAGVLAASGPTAGATTGTTTAGSTTSTGTTTVPAAPKPRGPRVARDDVRVAGIDISGLTAMTAADVVRASFDEPLVLVLGGKTFLVPPSRVGARAKVLGAVERALRAPAGTNVWLGVTVDRTRLDRYLASLAKRFDRAAVDAQLRLKNLRPVIVKDRRGRALDRKHATTLVVRALERNVRSPLRLRMKDVPAAVGRKDFGPIIVIRRGSNRLFLYRGTKYVRTFGVATGAAEYPTPLGRFHIVTMQRSPWWYPPDSDWAKDAKPIPPGPGNPLGTRWMGISAPAVGIHGTPDAASIGYSASHGCIRMRIPDAEWLFENVTVGAPVFIVAA